MTAFPTKADMVIVGAGSAGCVLAARLSEDPTAEVVVLEAGPSDTAPEIAMPAAAPLLWRGPLAWDGTTVPQPEGDGRSIFWPRGRVVGGGSTINGMVYIRGNPADYDGWAADHGCTGWSWDDLLPTFVQAEDQVRGPSAHHGAGGPLRVEDQSFVHPLSEAWVEAAVSSGLARNEDFNDGDQDGVGWYQLTQRDGRRWSVADAYLRPALGRPNLRLQTDVLVTGLVIEGGRACGVRVVVDGRVRTVRAEREVVVCAGAVRSPQLLLLSGIGPAEDLGRLGIEVVVDAPRVGADLQDHPMCLPEWSTPRVRNLWEDLTPENVARWEADGTGPMASGGAEAGGFGRSRRDLPAPDLQFGAIPGPAPDPSLGPPDHRAISALVGAVAAQSRGVLMLRSIDPTDEPLIDPRYLSEPADLDVLEAGVQQMREVAASSPLAEVIAEEVTPGADVDGGELRSWIRSTFGTMFHAAGTCAMGGDEEAVCAPDLTVRGVDGLRVADASVFPTLPRGNTNAPTIAVAERAASLVTASHGG